MIAVPLELFVKLDLEPIMVKAMDTEDGLGWSLEFTQTVAEEYRKFLTLCACYPDEAIVPSTIIDDLWHLHILDTQKYAEDCSQFLGYFLHHFPYFGMRGDADKENLTKAWLKTLDLYAIAFGTVPDQNLWPKSKRCPNCGKRSLVDSQYEYRPRLADLKLIAA